MITERFQVPGVSCQHCVNAITAEVGQVLSAEMVTLSRSTITHAFTPPAPNELTSARRGCEPDGIHSDSSCCR